MNYNGLFFSYQTQITVYVVYRAFTSSGYAVHWTSLSFFVTQTIKDWTSLNLPVRIHSLEFILVNAVTYRILSWSECIWHISEKSLPRFRQSMHSFPETSNLKFTH